MTTDLKSVPLEELRARWSHAWGYEPHSRLGRVMMEESLKFKEQSNLSSEQQARLDQLIKQYKRNPKCFDEGSVLKPGTRLSRAHQGKQHNVLVKSDGFEYKGRSYKGLSQIANDITGKRWNGWVFFGLKKAGA